MGVVRIVGYYNGSWTRGTKKVENHCSMQICWLKKILTLIWIMLKIL